MTTQDLATVINQMTARIAALDKVKGGLETALRKANTELAGLLGDEPGAAAAKPKRGRAPTASAPSTGATSGGNGFAVLNRSSGTPPPNDVAS